MAENFDNDVSLKRIEKEAYNTVIQIRELISALREFDKQRNSVDQDDILNTFLQFSPTATSDDYDSQYIYKNDEVELIMKRTLLPLLTLLIQQYSKLDAVLSSSSNTCNVKKVAPVGLISLQDYVNIACFLEMIVCIYFIPLFDKNVLPPVTQRMKYFMPKSLAGRMPQQVVLAFNKSTVLNFNNEEDIVEKMDLLLSAAEQLSELCCLDRFKPMMQRRHLVDIYSAVLHVCHYSYSSDRFEGCNILAAFGLSDGSNSSKHSSVDVFSASLALQTLLLNGTKTPGWLRRDAGMLLSQMAAKDLRSVVEVFVSAAKDAPESIISAAANRLGAAIVSYSSQVQIDCQQWQSLSTDEFYKSVCHQMIEMLDVELVGSERDPNVITVVSTFPLLPSLIAQKYFIAPILNPLYFAPTPSDEVGRSIKRICVLLSALPSPVNVLQILLDYDPSKSIKSCIETNLVGVLLRFISSAPVSQFKNEAELILLSVVQYIPKQIVVELLYKGLCYSESDRSIMYRPASNGGCEIAINLQPHIIPDDELLNKRARVVIEILQKDRVVNSEKEDSIIPCLFEHSLTAYLDMFVVKEQRGDLTSVLMTEGDKTVALVLLPLLCDECNIGDLIGSGEDVLNIIKKILDSSVYHDNIVEEDLVQLQSTAVLCLSLLIGLLELGSKNRSTKQENILQQLQPTLEKMMILKDINIRTSDELLTVKSEIADMASHACGLIISRHLEDIETDIMQHDDPTGYKIAAIEEDLSSPLVPLRARGMMNLRRLFQEITMSRDKALPCKNSLIQEITDNTDPHVFPVNKKLPSMEKVERLMILAINALDDVDSFVFLAAVQAITAIVDAFPNIFLRRLAQAVAQGQYQCNGSSITLSLAQRCKIGESFIFAVRRRGEAISGYAHKMISIMLFGCDIVVEKQTPVSLEISERMFDKTEEYFQRNRKDIDEEEKMPFEDIMLRRKAGGPVFNVEEKDSARATCISCLTELVLLSSPQLVSEYVSYIVRLCVNALRLESSRPVRRAASYLARSLYDSIMKEATENMRKKNIPVSQIAYEVILASESKLKTSLELITIPKNSLNGGGIALFDGAAVARCQEALDTRAEIDSFGVFHFSYAHYNGGKSDTPSILNIVKEKGEKDVIRIN